MVLMALKTKLDAAEEAILRSVLYSSLFEFPLRPEELRQSLLHHEMEIPDLLQTYDSSPALRQVIDYRQGYFFPRGRRDLIRLRKEREKRSRRRLAQMRWILKLLVLIPYTRLIAVSGSAAHLNLATGGDIDLFVITRGNRVWSVAVTILLLTKILGQRKTICSNFLLSDKRMSLERKDLFTANQIIHLKPICGSDVYRQFIKANPFVQEVYPGFRTETAVSVCDTGRIPGRLKRILEWLLWPGIGQMHDFLCRQLYSRYLRRRSSNWASPEEVVLEKDCLKLHSNSHRKEVLERFDRVVQKALSAL